MILFAYVFLSVEDVDFALACGLYFASQNVVHRRRAYSRSLRFHALDTCCGAVRTNNLDFGKIESGATITDNP